MLRKKCNRPMLLIERQRAMLLEVYKCIHELGPRYRHDIFSQKSRAYDYRDPSILTLPKYNTITHGKKSVMYEGTKLWNSISNGIKTIENISKFKKLLKKWNGSLYIIMYIAVRGPEAGGNKLRTYRKIKQQYTTQPYVNIIIAKKHRSAYAKFRCGVAPIKIETCRYGLNRLPIEQRVYEECQVVEDECHVIMHCTLYTDIRDQLFLEICENY